MADHGRVIIIESQEDYAAQLRDNKDKLIVVDFSASWCQPCIRIFPYVVEYSKEFTDVVFLKVDVDDNEDIAAANNIRAMPTFFFIKKGTKVDEIQGADHNGLGSKIEEHQVKTKTWGTGYRLSDAPPAPAPTAIDSPPSQDNLPLEEFLVQLMDMGFTVGQAQQALIQTNNVGLEQAIDWIYAHPESANVAPQTVDKPSADLTLKTPSNTEAMDVDTEGISTTEETKVEESFEERERKMKEKLAKAREARKLREEQDERERELNRVKGAAESTMTRRALEEQKRKDEIAAAKKKRLEEKRHKAEIRAKIQAAKEERMKKAGLITVLSPMEDKPVKKKKETPVKKKEYTVCSLAIRLPNGEVVKQDFQPTDTLRVVYEFLQNSHSQPSNFSICTNYPRKAYNGDSLNTTLQAADLVPRAALTVSYK